MANRTMLIATSAVPANQQDDSFSSMGLSEFNYDIPLIYTLLVSVNPRLCHSSVFEMPERLAIAGDAPAGLARLQALYDGLPGDAPNREPIATALAYLSKEHNRFPVYLLEPAEVFDMSGLPLGPQMDALLKDVMALDFDHVTKLGAGPLDYRLWATDCWSSVLYFVPRGQVKPPPDLGRSRLTLSVLEVFEHAALFPGLSSLESLTLKLDEGDVDKALRIIGSAPALTHLTVSGTIAQLPRSIGAMRTLTGLNLRGLGLESVPDSLGDLAALEFLNLAGNRLNTLPHSLKQLNRLDSLNLSENPVNDLSIEFAELEALEELNLMGTALRELPEVVFALPALQRLYLGNSAIREIPGRIGALGRLTGLNIANLELESLPDGFWELTSLGGLTAEGNRFGNNASGFQWQRLTALKLVNVRACGLEVVPEAFGELPELVRIDLRDNRIATVPEQLRRKPLDWIGLQGNPHGYGRSDFNAKAIGL